MKEIKLTQDKVTVVDDEDFIYLNQFKWYARKCRYTFYAQRGVKINGKWKKIQMHRIIINPPENMQIDHINRNALDNRKENLRIVTHSQNHFNEKIRTDNKSGYKGIFWKKSHKKWEVRLSNKYLGIFLNITDAIKCRDYHFNKLP